MDIIDDEISTTKAFKIFRSLELDDKNHVKPQQTGGEAAPSDSRFNQDLPSIRIERMKRELADLQKELQELEKEEIPTRMAA